MAIKIIEPSVMVIPEIKNGNCVGFKYLWTGLTIDTPHFIGLRKEQGDLIEINGRYYLAKDTYSDSKETNRSILKEVVVEGSERLKELNEEHHKKIQDKFKRLNNG